MFSVTLNYDFEHMNVKSITSYAHDQTYSKAPAARTRTQQQRIVGGPVNPTAAVSPFPAANGIVGFPLWGVFPDYPGHFMATSNRYGIQEELRFSSAADQRPLTWVAGLYYSNQRIRNYYFYPDSKLTPSLMSFWGINLPQRYGIAATINNAGTQLNANIADNELAAFAEANYWLTDKLKVTGGIRMTRIDLPVPPDRHGRLLVALPQHLQRPGHRQELELADHAQDRPDLRVHPQRPGLPERGQGLPGRRRPTRRWPRRCAGRASPSTASPRPTCRRPSGRTRCGRYEAGGKFRMLDNKLQVNGAVYRIDWTGIQSSITLTCGQGFVINGGKARSQGVDFQGQYRPFRPLTLTLNVGYDDAKYIDPVAGPRGVAPGVLPSINAGDPFAIPKWQVSFSANYDVTIGGVESYVRADYQWQSAYNNPGSFGVAAWNPFNLRQPMRDVWNVRAGAQFGAVDVNVFANNILNGHDRIGNAGVGKTQCVATSRDCSIYNNFNPFVNQAVQRPREIGVQANYRF